MNHKKDPRMNRDEELAAENNLLKLKLGLEHGMSLQESEELSPQIENQWLKHVYAFEQQYKDAKEVRLYDYLGQPHFKKSEALAPNEVKEELSRLHEIMMKNGVQLDCLCEYDDMVIYKFITEELFSHMIDDMRIPGMVCHYTYEEFHPNHNYDLRRQTRDFIENIFENEWNPDYDVVSLARDILFSEKLHNREGISGIIQAFQEAHTSLKIEELDITEVVIDNEITRGDIRARLSASGKKQNDRVLYDGECSLHFIREDGYWYIDAFQLPGF